MKINRIFFYSLILLFVCCKGETSDVEKLTAQRDSLQTVSNEKQQNLENLYMFVNEVSMGLDSIAFQEGLINNSGPEGHRMTREELRENLKELSQILARHRARIAMLEDSLHIKGANTEGLRKIVNHLNNQLAAKENTIKQLQTELSNKNANIASLQSRVRNLGGEVERLDKQNKMQQRALTIQSEIINEGFIKIASRKELKKLGILKGGFLRAKKLDPSALNQDNFNRINISTFTEVTIQSKKPKILTTMPASSYIMTPNGNGTTTLTITNPSQFWSSSNFLVISLD